MQDADAGIPLGTHMCHKENKLHKLCFTGEEHFEYIKKNLHSLNFTLFTAAHKFEGAW